MNGEYVDWGLQKIRSSQSLLMEKKNVLGSENLEIIFLWEIVYLGHLIGNCQSPYNWIFRV